MPFRAPFGTDVYVRNRLRIADSIPLLAGTDSFLGTADLHRRSIPESGISKFVGSEIHESMISGGYPIISIFKILLMFNCSIFDIYCIYIYIFNNCKTEGTGAKTLNWKLQLTFLSWNILFILDSGSTTTSAGTFQPGRRNFSGEDAGEIESHLTCPRWSSLRISSRQRRPFLNPGWVLNGTFLIYGLRFMQLKQTNEKRHHFYLSAA